MGALLQELHLSNFRNHESFTIRKPKQLIIIIGNNATGKTNIIEATQLVTMLESFRSPRWPSVVKKSTDSEKAAETRIRAQFLQNERIVEIEMEINEGKRAYTLNGKKRNKNDLVGLIPAVLFVPDDMMLIKGSSEIRRRAVDDIGQQLSSTYLKILNDYQKTVKQRNIILKSFHETERNYPLLESWDENLIVLGALLFVHRVRLFQRLTEKAESFHKQINQGEQLTSRYRPSFFTNDEEASPEEGSSTPSNINLLEIDKKEVEWWLYKKIAEMRETEIIRAQSLVGPHRDDISFYINGLDTRKYASQGQQRSIVLALKMGQLELIREISGNQPILLLDDVMSELDETRRAALIRAIDGQMQTIITSTDLKCFSETLLENAQIIKLS